VLFTLHLISQDRDERIGVLPFNKIVVQNASMIAS
jgi:hypothetical protein